MNTVITGASRGIGLELAREALSKECQVLAIARNTDSPGLKELKKTYPEQLTLINADLSEADAPEMVNDAVSSWPQVDLLINNAGTYRKGESRDDFLFSFRVNSIAPFLMTKELLPKLRKSKKACVASITSLMGSITDNGSGGSYAYRSSKAALNMINKSLAVDHDWLTSIVIHPGWVKTEMGGSGAPVEPRDSAAGIWKVLSILKSGDSGRFFDFRGKSLPW